MANATLMAVLCILLFQVLVQSKCGKSPFGARRHVPAQSCLQHSLHTKLILFMFQKVWLTMLVSLPLPVPLTVLQAGFSAGNCGCKVLAPCRPVNVQSIIHNFIWCSSLVKRQLSAEYCVWYQLWEAFFSWKLVLETHRAGVLPELGNEQLCKIILEASKDLLSNLIIYLKGINF